MFFWVSCLEEHCSTSGGSFVSSSTGVWTDFEDLNMSFHSDTVDGRNPAPVDMINSPLLIGFHTSQVVQDFFHQQYYIYMNF